MVGASGGRIARALRVALPLAAVATMALSAPGSAALPAPDQLVANTVARVSEVPRSLGIVTRGEFRHAKVLAAAGGRRGQRKAGRRGLEHKALDSLLEMIWIKGQAAEMDISVPRQQVLRELALIKEENFSGAAEYREFLRRTRLTPRDVYQRVELQMLSTRIQRRILAGTESEAEEQEAFERFVREFSERWRARTVCAPAHAIDSCSNGPAPS